MSSQLLCEFLCMSYMHMCAHITLGTHVEARVGYQLSSDTVRFIAMRHCGFP